MAFDKNGRCESCGSSIKNNDGLCCECLDWPDRVRKLKSDIHKLLNALRPFVSYPDVEIRPSERETARQLVAHLGREYE